MFWLIYITMNIRMSCCGSNAGMETSAPQINVVVNNALFHFNLRNTHQSDSASSHPHPVLFMVDSLPYILK